jgi:hypothetical protein
MMTRVVLSKRLRPLDVMQQAWGFQNMKEGKEKEISAMIDPGVEPSMSLMKRLGRRQQHGTESFMKLLPYEGLEPAT